MNIILNKDILIDIAALLIFLDFWNSYLLEKAVEIFQSLLKNQINSLTVYLFCLWPKSLPN